MHLWPTAFYHCTPSHAIVFLPLCWQVRRLLSCTQRAWHVGAADLWCKVSTLMLVCCNAGV